MDKEKRKSMSRPTFEQVFGEFVRDAAVRETFAGAEVLALDINKPSSWLTVQLKLSAFVDFAAVTAAERAFPGSEIDWAGAHRISADNAQIARADSSACLPATCALMLALCMFAFRNRLFAVAAVAPSLLGSAAAFCFARAVFDEISSISVAFASIAMGVGIDYAIHILYPLDLRGKFGIDFAAKTAGELSLPVSVICATTLLAFIAVACLGGGMAQLGIFGFAGVAASAAISVLALPAFAAGISRGGLRPTFLEKFSGKLVVSQLRGLFYSRRRP